MNTNTDVNLQKAHEDEIFTGNCGLGRLSNVNLLIFGDFELNLGSLDSDIAVFSIMVEKWGEQDFWDLRQINGFKRFSAAVRRPEEKIDLFLSFTHVSL